MLNQSPTPSKELIAQKPKRRERLYGVSDETCVPENPKKSKRR